MVPSSFNPRAGMDTHGSHPATAPNSPPAWARRFSCWVLGQKDPERAKVHRQNPTAAPRAGSSAHHSQTPFAWGITQPASSSCSSHRQRWNNSANFLAALSHQVSPNSGTVTRIPTSQHTFLCLHAQPLVFLGTAPNSLLSLTSLPISRAPLFPQPRYYQTALLW